jgi:hypothetical protein
MSKEERYRNCILQVVDSKGWDFGLFWAGKGGNGCPPEQKRLPKRKSGSQLPHSRHSYLQNQLYHGLRKSQEKVFKNNRRVEPRGYASAAPFTSRRRLES